VFLLLVSSGAAAAAASESPAQPPRGGDSDGSAATAEATVPTQQAPAAMAAAAPAQAASRLRGAPAASATASAAATAADDAENAEKSGTVEPPEVSAQEAGLRPCAHREECLQIIDAFLQRQPRQQPAPLSLLQAYDEPTAGGGGPCGALCHLRPRCVSERCRYYVYDNAVAAIYFTHRGNLSEAKVILESLKSLLYPTPRALKLLYSAYSANGDVLDWSIDTGNNAWAGMAFVHFAAASGDACYAHIARDILHSLADQAGCYDDLQGFMGRLPRGVGKYRATEHNIDMFALARMLGEQDLQARAGNFVSRMYSFNPGSPQTYATGTAGKSECDAIKDWGSPVAADTQFWNLLADADPDPSRKRTSLQLVLRPSSEGGLLTEDEDILGDRARLLGVRFTTAGSGAQWENTASAVMGIGFYDAIYGDEGATVSTDFAGMRDSLLHQLVEYRSVLASVRGGNYDAYEHGNPDPAFPGGSDTGLGWAYLRYPHLAATAWTGLMLLEANPFALPDGGLPTSVVDESCPASR